MRPTPSAETTKTGMTKNIARRENVREGGGNADGGVTKEQRRSSRLMRGGLQEGELSGYYLYNREAFGVKKGGKALTKGGGPRKRRVGNNNEITVERENRFEVVSERKEKPEHSVFSPPGREAIKKE